MVDDKQDAVKVENDQDEKVEQEEVDKSKIRVLITGVSGFIASITCKLLLERGYTVRGTVRSKKNAEKKYKYLLELPGADKRLELVEGNLLDDGSYDDAVIDCDYVLHTASPFILSYKDAQKELIDPAVNGTLSVLKSIKKYGKNKRVVLTSSMASITDSPINGKTYTEEDWNTTSSLKRNAYYYSKVQAEKAAIKFCDDEKIDLVRICPMLVVGKALTSSIGESTKMIKSLFDGVKGFPYVPDLKTGFVDVTDVAMAHILAFEKEEAKGRYIVTNKPTHLADVAKHIREKYPKLPCAKKTWTGKFWTGATKLASYSQPKAAGQYIRYNLGKDFDINNDRLVKDLFGDDHKLLTANEAISNTVDWLVKHEYVKAAK